VPEPALIAIVYPTALEQREVIVPVAVASPVAAGVTVPKATLVAEIEQEELTVAVDWKFAVVVPAKEEAETAANAKASKDCFNLII
jgi:hypothetical protein